MFVDVVVNHEKETVCVNIDAITMITKINEGVKNKFKFRLHLISDDTVDITLDDYWAIRSIKNATENNYKAIKTKVQDYIHAFDIEKT